jgi:hypothetical protein
MRTRLAFGLGLSLALACQSKPLVSTDPTGPSSGSAGAEGTPCPAPQTRCGAACVDEATDAQNCGGCGLVCDHCTDGRCVRVLASAQSNPLALAVTSSDVVWANQGNDTAPGQVQGAAILRAPIGGGALQTLAALPEADNMLTSQSLAVDSGNVYWAKFNVDSGDGAIMKTPLAGGATTTLASASVPESVAVSGGVVYWTAVGGIMSVPTTGGAPVVFEPGHAFPLTLAAAKAIWFDLEGNSLAIRTRELAPGAGDVTLGAWDISPPQGACLPSMTTSHAGRIWLASSTTDLYWTYSADAGGCAAKLPLSGGAPSTIEWDLDANALAVDAASVYWIVESVSPTAGPNISQILKAPLASGTPISLAKMAGGVGSLVVDDASLYFTDTFGGNVVKVTPK